MTELPDRVSRSTKFWLNFLKKSTRSCYTNAFVSTNAQIAEKRLGVALQVIWEKNASQSFIENMLDNQKPTENELSGTKRAILWCAQGEIIYLYLSHLHSICWLTFETNVCMV